MVRTVQTQPSQRWLHIIILNVQVKWLRPCFDKLYLGLQVGFGKYVPQWVVLTEIQTDQKNASILALPLLLIVNKIQSKEMIQFQKFKTQGFFIKLFFSPVEIRMIDGISVWELFQLMRGHEW